MQDHDSLWKNAIDAFLFECIEFCWPAAFALVDCSVAPLFLEQELAPVTGARRRRLDKLVQLAAKSGSQLVLHIEVQHHYDSNFERRMFSYLCRLQEKYICPVYSLAILADSRRHWRPSSILLPLLDGEIQLRYPIFKLLDWENKADDLTNSKNPFAVFAAIDLLGRHFATT